jgi:hypothetical protein
MLAAPPDPDTLTTFIEDVAPNVRDRVGAGRAEARLGADHIGGKKLQEFLSSARSTKGRAAGDGSL